MDLPRLGEVGDASVRAHQNVGWVQSAFEEATLAFAKMYPAQRSFG